jgi:RNA polymerase sigma factor (sigma-70 family)
MMGVMKDESDGALLMAFAVDRDERAFAEVVRRWGALVYAVAMRRTGDAGLAEEAAQNVLATVARRARELSEHPALAAWLHKAATYEAIRAREKEANRRRHLKIYAKEMTPSSTPSVDPGWDEVLPLLDAAVASLPERDRQVVLLRYWQKQPYRAIAETAGGTAAAWEKRAERALAKLSRLLRQRGLVLSATALAAGLPSALTHAAPPLAVLDRLSDGAMAAAKSAPAGAGPWLDPRLAGSKAAAAAWLAGALVLGCAAGVAAARLGGTAMTNPRSIAAEGAAARGTGLAKPAPLPGSVPRSSSLHTLLAAAQRDLVTATVDPSAAARAAARVALIEPVDLEAALAVADELVAASSDASPLAALVLQRWAEIDPQTACETAHARRSGGRLGLPPLADPLKVWAARDPQAAFAWFRAKASTEEVKEGAGQRWKPISSLRWIMGAWALQDAPAAAQAFRSLTRQEEIDGALTGFSELSATAPGRTQLLDAWMDRGTATRNPMIDLHSLLQRWSEHRPEELAAWLDRNHIDASSHDATAKPILTGWLRDDPEAAVDWWFNAPGGYPDRAHRLSTLIEAWVETDVFAAADWLATQPLDATTSPSVATLAGRIARSDPERGWAWALRIPEPTHRLDALRQVATTWARTDQPAAAAAVESANFDAPTRARLIEATTTP